MTTTQNQTDHVTNSIHWLASFGKFTPLVPGRYFKPRVTKPTPPGLKRYKAERAMRNEAIREKQDKIILKGLEKDKTPKEIAKDLIKKKAHLGVNGKPFTHKTLLNYISRTTVKNNQTARSMQQIVSDMWDKKHSIEEIEKKTKYNHTQIRRALRLANKIECNKRVK